MDRTVTGVHYNEIQLCMLVEKLLGRRALMHEALMIKDPKRDEKASLYPYGSAVVKYIKCIPGICVELT